jgi:hypothetical protein
MAQRRLAAGKVGEKQKSGIGWRREMILRELSILVKDEIVALDYVKHNYCSDPHTNIKSGRLE